MKKEAYYFPHFCNARSDRKIKRLRKELGVEGYGIYFMLLEVLREQKDFKYPIKDLDLLADEFGTSEQKIMTVIHNYQLFELDEENFFSLKFIEYLKPYLLTRYKNRINGIKGNMLKYKYLTKEQLDGMSDAEIIEFNDNKDFLQLKFVGSESGGESLGDRKKRKEKERKGEKRKVNNNKDTMSCEKIDYKAIVDYLNMKTGKNYKSTTKKTQALIKARFNEGFTKEDFLKVVDTKVIKWGNDPKMKQYLRPETLFGNKFESYLNEEVTLSDQGIMSAKMEKDMDVFTKWAEKE